MTIDERFKPLYISLYAILSLILFSFATSGASYIMSKWFGILVGIGLMLIAIPFFALGDRNKIFYVVCMILNTSGMGFIASAYYVVKAVPVNIPSFILASLLPLFILLVCSVILACPINDTAKAVTFIVVCILMLALIIISIVFWTKRGGEYYAFSTFASIVVAFFLGAVIYCADDEDRNSLPCASLCTFGALLSVFLVVLIALGGDGCDCDCGGCDGCDCGGGKKSRKLK